MKKMIAFLLLLAAPLMAQHATQFAYYSTNICQDISAPSASSSQSNDSQEAGPANPFSAVVWDSDTQVSTEGFSLGGSVTIKSCVGDEITGSTTIYINHAGWYFAKFLISGKCLSVAGDFRFGILNVNELAFIPFSVYGVQTHDSNNLEQLAGQVIFYAPANTHIQLVNDGMKDAIVNPDTNGTFLTSLYIFELLGR